MASSPAAIVDRTLLPLLTALLTALLLASLAGPALAATPATGAQGWIRDTLYVPLRRGPSGQHGIIRTLVSGTPVILVSATPANDNDFVEVTTADGGRGWLPAQYLTDSPIAEDQLTTVRAEVASLRSAAKAADTRLGTALAERDSLRDTLSATSTELDNLRASYNKLQGLSADTVAIHAQSGELANLNTLLQAEVERLATALHNSQDANNNQQLIIGGVLVLLGLAGGAWVRGRRRSGWA